VIDFSNVIFVSQDHRHSEVRYGSVIVSGRSGQTEVGMDEDDDDADDDDDHADFQQP
jgi:alpha-tubulin suppressor-like RCC1 family protein